MTLYRPRQPSQKQQGERIHILERLGINFIHAKSYKKQTIHQPTKFIHSPKRRTRVQPRKRRYRSPHPRRRQRSLGIHHRGIVSAPPEKVHHQAHARKHDSRIVQVPNFIVNMAHKDISDNVWREAVNDLVKEVGGVGKGVGAVPACCGISEMDGSGDVAHAPGKTCPRIHTRCPLSSASCSSSVTKRSIPLTSGFEVYDDRVR